MKSQWDSLLSHRHHLSSGAVSRGDATINSNKPQWGSLLSHRHHLRSGTGHHLKAQSPQQIPVGQSSQTPLSGTVSSSGDTTINLNKLQWGSTVNLRDFQCFHILLPLHQPTTKLICVTRNPFCTATCWKPGVMLAYCAVARFSVGYL